MLKLPAVRVRLQILFFNDPSLIELYEAYEIASVTLQRLRSQTGEAHCPMVEEYQTICSEIEEEALNYCLEHPAPVA